MTLGVNATTAELVVSQKELWKKLIRPAAKTASAPDSPAPAPASPQPKETEAAPQRSEPAASQPTTAAAAPRQPRPRPEGAAAAAGPAEVIDPANILTINQLVDMQWRFGLTAGNSGSPQIDFITLPPIRRVHTDEADFPFAEVRRVGESFLQMKLTIDQGNGTQKIVRLGSSFFNFFFFASL
jgi:hypothetical protein